MNAQVVPALGGVLTFLFSLIVFLAAFGGWVLFLIAAWRGMKAHESIAESLKRIADRPS